MHGLPSRADAFPLRLEEYARLPEEDAFLLELSRGLLVREPRPGARHGAIVLNVVQELNPFVREHGLGRVVIEAGFLLTVDPPTVRGPDVAFISAARLPDGPLPDGFWSLAPDLAVEVVSPSNSAGNMQEKVLQYLDAGSREVWVVQPNTRTIEVWRPGVGMRVVRDDGTLDGGDIIPGLRLAVADLFAE